MSKERVKAVARIIGPDTAHERRVGVLDFTRIGPESIHTFNTDMGKMVSSWMCSVKRGEAVDPGCNKGEILIKY